MNSIKLNRKNLLLCYILFCETIFMKMIQYDVFPTKYFYDSISILNKTKYEFVADKSFTFTANFFKVINLFGFNTVQQWSWTLGLIFTIILIFIILKYDKYNIGQMIFIIASFLFLNLYVFNISKDAIQFIIFLFIFAILNSAKLSEKKKLIFSCLILALEAYYFRIYYLIMAIIMIDIYFVYNIFFKNKKTTNKSKIKIIFLTMVVFFAQIFVLQAISTENYESIMYARSSVNIYRENSSSAVTLIKELFGNNDNYGIFILNYIINFFRLLFPVELILKGPKYLAFIIYQFFISFNLIIGLKKVDEKNLLYLIVMLGFILISTIFEPDFGSFIRHESALFVIILQVNIFNELKRKGKNNEEMYSL